MVANWNINMSLTFYVNKLFIERILTILQSAKSKMSDKENKVFGQINYRQLFIGSLKNNISKLQNVSEILIYSSSLRTVNPFPHIDSF